MPHLFDPFAQKSMKLRNRIVMSPMCLFMAGSDGVPTDWHMVHLGARAVGGVGMVMTEATAVDPAGRIAETELGLWNDDQGAAFERIANFVHENGAAFSIQLAHAGRKAWGGKYGYGPTEPVGPSPVPYANDWRTPVALDRAGIDQIVAAFRSAAARARDVGCDSVEVHAAHGYLIHQFLSPLSNHRTDEYGGSLENRARLLKRVVAAVQAEFPADRPVWVRISAEDWVAGGFSVGEAVELASMLKEWGVDLVDVSSGGNSPLQRMGNAGPGFQVPFAERIRQETGIATGAVGSITTPEQADQIIRTGQADVVIMARELARNPFFALRAAHVLKHGVPWPRPYDYVRFPDPA